MTVINTHNEPAPGAPGTAPAVDSYAPVGAAEAGTLPGGGAETGTLPGGAAPAPAGKGTRTLQAIAGVIFFLTFALTIFQDWGMVFLVGSPGIHTEGGYRILAYCSALAALIPWLLCIFIASNRTNRMAAILMTVVILVMNGFSMFVQKHFNELVSDIIYAVILLLIVYVYLIILKNNDFPAKIRSWVFFLVIGELPSLINISVPMILLGNEIDYSTTVFFSNPFLTVVYIISFFWAIAFWKLVHSQAFSGRFDKSSTISLVPDVKALVVFLVSAALSIGVIFLFK